ncbi:hypothetical protein MRX96_004479 [Rhipicephalus microplus]
MRERMAKRLGCPEAHESTAERKGGVGQPAGRLGSMFSDSERGSLFKTPLRPASLQHCFCIQLLSVASEIAERACGQVDHWSKKSCVLQDATRCW